MGYINAASVLLLVLGISYVSGQTMPAGCTYSKGMYECVYTQLSTPISATSFSNPIPQRLRLTAIPATLNSAIFNANFASMSTSNFDTNFAATLELKCDGNSAVTISQAAFTNMNLFQDVKIINCQVTLNANTFALELKDNGNSAVTISQAAFTNMNLFQDVKIINCQVTLNANTFANFVALDRVVIENGTIASIDAATFTGVNITKITNPNPSYPVKTGEIFIKNSRVTGGTLPAALLSGQTNLISVSLEGLGLTSIDGAFFSTNTKLRYISLSRNSFSTIPTTLFDGLDSLAEVQMYETTLPCTCAELWFFGLAKTTKMKIYGDILCSSPAGYEYFKAVYYYYQNCVPETKSCSDGVMELMGDCLQALDLAMYIITVVAFIVACVVLGLAIHARRRMGAGGKSGARGKKLPAKKGAGPKGAKKGWA